MNTHETATYTSGRERLQAERDTCACHCAQAVASGDFGAAVDWASKYEAVCARLTDLIGTTGTGEG